MPELESEESAAQGINQGGHGLKILTPNQMRSRLPISIVSNNVDQTFIDLFCKFF